MPDPRFAKLVVFVNAVVPLSLLLWDGAFGSLGVNPVEFAIRTTGMLALIFLMLSLCVTPLRRITGVNYFSHFRRMLGLFAFFYGCVHLCLYFIFDRGFDLVRVVEDMLQRPFIFFGAAALLLMLPLAITSTNKMIKRLGAMRWKRLHRLAYVAAWAGVGHYYLLVKADTRKPSGFAIALGILLVFRLIYFLTHRPGAKAAVA
ncbi:MAG TPA: protein-methionine-sulfoxide reductase heme-binding subunit MsrQ [Tepidisphaeraceae bacterium]|jgi:sulfoxide reductase heme-binding subunit YedZ